MNIFVLDENPMKAAQEYIVGQIREGYTHGTTGGVRLDGHISNGDHSMYNGIPPWAR